MNKSLKVSADIRLSGELALIYAAERLNIKPWVDTPKERFVRVRVRNISGRRFYAAPTSAAAS